MIEGLVELFGEVVRCSISPMRDGSHNVYLNDDLYDGTSFEEFVKDTGNKIYATLEDYKKGNSNRIL